MVQSIYHQKQKQHKPEKRSFEHVLGDEDLVGGVNEGTFEGTTVDLGNAVEGGSQQNDQGGAEGLNDEGAATSLEAIQRDDDQLSHRSFEEEAEDDKHLAKNEGVEKLQHFGTKTLEWSGCY